MSTTALLVPPSPLFSSFFTILPSAEITIVNQYFAIHPWYSAELTFAISSLGTGTPALAVEAPVAITDKLRRWQRFHSQHLVDLPEGHEAQEHLSRNGDIFPLLSAEIGEGIFRFLLTWVQQTGAVDQDRWSYGFHHSTHTLARWQWSTGRWDDLFNEQFSSLERQ